MRQEPEATIWAILLTASLFIAIGAGAMKLYTNATNTINIRLNKALYQQVKCNEVE